MENNMIGRFFLNVYARFALRIFCFNYRFNPQLDEIFEALMRAESGDIDTTQYWLKIKTSLLSVEAWNANKYYAWLSQGTAQFANGTRMTWNNERPSVWVMCKMRRALRDHVSFCVKSELYDSAVLNDEKQLQDRFNDPS